MFLYVYMTPFCKENRVSCLCEKLRRTNAEDPISYLWAAGGWEKIHSSILFPVLLNGLSFDSEHVSFYNKENVCFCCVIWKCLLHVRPKKRLSLTFQWSKTLMSPLIIQQQLGVVTHACHSSYL